jgi:hypothetical protein
VKIRFARSGGFAGLTTRLELNPARLPSQERAEIEKLIHDSRFFDLRAQPAPTAPDAFQYDLEIEDEGKSHHLIVGETAVPASLRPLIDKLVEVARRKPA